MAPIKRIIKSGIVSKMSNGNKLSSLKQPICDIFPRHISKRVGKLNSYPVFKNLVGNEHVKAYVFYMEKESRKIYFLERQLVDKYVDHFKLCGKVSQIMEDFRPNKIDWSKVKNKYQKDTSDTNRSNIDTRVAFRIENMYLVKAFFTFGQRTVTPETAHIIQTLNVPLLFFLKNTEKLIVQKRLFPYDEILLYDRRILEPNQCFRIPPNTTYFIVSTQKNCFSVDIVRENYKIPFEYVDPVATRVSNFKNYIDLPIKTPYADPETAGVFEVCSDNEGDEMQQEANFQPPTTVYQTSFETINQQTIQQPSFETINQQTIQQPSFEAINQQPSFEAPPQTSIKDMNQQAIQQPSFEAINQQPSFNESVNQTPPQNEFFEMDKQNMSVFNGYNGNDMANMLDEFYSPVQENATNQQVLYYVLPQQNSFYNENSPIFEKNITVASQDFITAYRKMKAEYLNPRLIIPPSDALITEPMDLSTKNDILDMAMDTLLAPLTPEKENEMDDIINDLFNSTPLIDNDDECNLLNL